MSNNFLIGLKALLISISKSPNYPIKTTYAILFLTVFINNISSHEILFQFSSVGGMDDNIDDDTDPVDLMILHACIQSDPGEPTSWKEALYGPERDWWLKSTISEFNNFLSRKAWKFVDRKSVYEQGQKIIKKN